MELVQFMQDFQVEFRESKKALDRSATDSQNSGNVGKGISRIA